MEGHPAFFFAEYGHYIIEPQECKQKFTRPSLKYGGGGFTNSFRTDKIEVSCRKHRFPLPGTEIYSDNSPGRPPHRYKNRTVTIYESRGFAMYHIIINPASRSGRGLRIWKRQIEPVLLKKSIPFQAYFSEKAGDTVHIVETLTSRREDPVTLIIVGGDGTVNEALQGMKEPSRVTLGYIPTGSSNDLARDLKIPKNAPDALDLILHTGNPHLMDIGCVVYPDGERRRFAVSCGLGFDAAVCQEALHSKIKNTMNRLHLGKLTYLGIALRQLLAAKAVSGKLILENNAPIDIPHMLFTACMIHRFEGGGFMFAPDADPHDGLLDLCAVGDLPKSLILFALPTAFWGKHYRFRGVTPYRTSSLTIETTLPLWVHTDGEVTRKSNRIHVTCEKNALHMIF